jgi:hypothetical protein
MVILIIQVKDFSFGLVDFERDPPITGDAETPDTFTVAGELVRVPDRDIAELQNLSAR